MNPITLIERRNSMFTQRQVRLHALVVIVALAWLSVSSNAQDIANRSKVGSIGTSMFYAVDPALVPPLAPYSTHLELQQFYNNSTSDIPLRRSRPATLNNANAPPLRSRPLLNSTPVAEGIKSGYYVSEVGGIAFDSLAAPKPPLKVTSIELRYDQLQPDGNRLVAVVNGRRYAIRSLPDWQLVPIARYADSPYFATVTLFGELEYPFSPPPNAEYIVSFHPALESTLLGLRLFQADYMLLDPNLTGELPRFDGKYLLGAGEEAPQPQVWRTAATALNQIVARGEKFDSYVLRDAGPPLFALSGRSRSAALLMRGQLYFHFWARGADMIEQRNEGQQTIQYQSFRPVHLEAISEAVSSRTELLEQANPAVYRSTLNTMLYSALFRYCKQEDEEKWSKFLESLNRVPDDKIAAPTPVILFQKR